jgi:hypothetical protein
MVPRCPVELCWARPGEACMFPARFACLRNQPIAAADEWTPAALDRAAGLIAWLALAWAGPDPARRDEAEAILAASPVLGGD